METRASKKQKVLSKDMKSPPVIRKRKERRLTVHYDDEIEVLKILVGLEGFENIRINEEKHDKRKQK